MYAKIQKDNSNNYILIESSNIELSYQKLPIPYSEYVMNILPCLIEYSEEQNCRFKIGEMLRAIFGRPDWPNTVAATNWDLYGCSKFDNDVDFGCDVKGVKVNGTYYVTCGNIYIMNDKGQTIQKI